MKTKRIQTHRLGRRQIESMYEVMKEYYDGMSRPEFERDLLESDSVILLMSHDGGIQGFSTQIKYEMNLGGKKRIALFSGDTVLRQKYWGNGALKTAFGRYLFSTKLKYPFTEVYWFLSSKGYRTTC